MRAQLMWTINDFSAYADLSCWPNRGVKACPCCMHSTRSKYLKNGKKVCSMGHKRYLSTEHLWRLNRRTFDRTEELECAPDVPSGDVILRQLDGIAFGDEDAGKKKWKKRKMGARSSDDVVWNKKSIFFRLSYWKDNLLRHNLDVMHIEKNVMDNILGTILDISGKMKDNLAARLDLQEMELRPKLHPFIAANGKTYIPAACHTMSREDKENFLKVLRNVRVPEGYASNISQCVRLKERTISGLKSHDSHILMQQLLPIALRQSLPDQMVRPLVELSAFFRGICSTQLTQDDMDRLQGDVCTTLCKLEQVFPPGFLTSMVHLIVHLVRECRLRGPVQYRWTYPAER
jgi:hypothetical protein